MTPEAWEESAQLFRSVSDGSTKVFSISLREALAGDPLNNILIEPRDRILVHRQPGRVNPPSVNVRGEVARAGRYPLVANMRVSDLVRSAGGLLRSAGGLLPTAYPQAAVFERIDVREMQQKSRQELIQRLEQESTVVKTSVTTSGTDEAALHQAATQQRQRILEALRRAPISGRLVVHVRQGQQDFAGSPDGIELRAGDTLEIPKQPGFVVVVGQVYNSNAIAHSPGKHARSLLSRT